MRLAIIIGISIIAGFTSANDSNNNVNVVFAEEEPNPCATNESCVLLETCTAYNSGFKSRGWRMHNQYQYVEFMKSRQCGFEGLKSLVCCPKISNGAKRPESENKISYSECGKDLNYRHKSGVNTELSEFPWLALLEYDTMNGREFLCSGVLISDQYILTAAHCVSAGLRNLTTVHLGEYNTRTNIDCTFKGGSKICADASVEIGVEEEYYHEGYMGNGITHRIASGSAADENKGIVINFGTGEMPDSDHFDDFFMSHDIGLIKLKHKVTFSPYIQPICLPEHSHAKQKFLVSGWGKNPGTEGSDRKRKSALTEVDNSDCQNISVLPFVTEEHICAGIKDIRERPCVADSGGPLMGYEEKADGTLRVTVFGVSYTDKYCQDTSLPGVYTGVYDHMPWILQQIGQK